MLLFFLKKVLFSKTGNIIYASSTSKTRQWCADLPAKDVLEPCCCHRQNCPSGIARWNSLKSYKLEQGLKKLRRDVQTDLSTDVVLFIHSCPALLCSGRQKQFTTQKQSTEVQKKQMNRRREEGRLLCQEIFVPVLGYALQARGQTTLLWGGDVKWVHVSWTWLASPVQQLQVMSL